MASFIGTNKELRRYIGPRLRNLVQQITKNHKTNAAACEHCGNSENLESAHILGRDRNDIIDLVASEYTFNGITTIDIGVLEEKFITEHEPFEKSILILCRSCHRKYDAKNQIIIQSRSSATESTKNTQELTIENDLLPITLDPSNPEDFKKELLISRAAEILRYYSDGRIESTPWNASRFKITSNVLGNLRSRPDFRSNNWKSIGLVKIHVKVIPSTEPL